MTSNVPASGDAMIRDITRRLTALERRRSAMSALDLLGPGIASYAVEIIDWNTNDTTLNGFYHSAPGSLHSPDEDLSWTGQTIAKDDGTGMQQVWNTDGTVPVYYVRTYKANVVDGGAPVFDTWKKFATESGLIEGDMLDPDTFPGTMDPTNPPDDSPTPVTRRGPAAVIVDYEYTSGETVDLYVWVPPPVEEGGTYDTPPTLGPEHLHTEDFPVGGFVYTDPDGVTLPPEPYPVYVALWANNVVGPAPAPSAWVSGVAGQIPPEFMELLVGELIAQRLEADTITGVLITGSELDIVDSIHAYPGFLDVIAQKLTAYEALFDDKVDMRGLDNFLRGTLTATSGVEDPPGEPTVQKHWPAFSTDADTTTGTLATQYVGLCDAPGALATTHWLTTRHITGKTTGAGVVSISKTTGEVDSAYEAFTFQFYARGGVCSNGTYAFVLGYDIGIAAWRVKKYDDTGALVATYNPAIGNPDINPVIGRSGDGFAVLFEDDVLFSYAERIKEFSSTGTLVNDVSVPTTHNTARQYRGLYRVASSPLTYHVVRQSGTTSIWTFKDDGADNLERDTAQDIEIANNNTVKGMYHDGTRIRHLNQSGTVMTYSTYNGGTPGAVFTYVDGDPAGLGEAESGASNVGSATIPKAAWIKVISTPPPDNGEVDDPDRNYLYLGSNAAATKYRVAELDPGELSDYFETIPVSGDVPPSPSEFDGRATATVAELRSYDGGWFFKGDNDWQITGPNVMDSGWLTPTGAWTGRVRYTRIGQQVFATGYVARASGNNSSLTAIGGVTIPTWARPASQSFVCSGIFFSSGGKYRFRADTNGDFNVQQSAADTEFQIISGSWFTDA